MASVAVIGGGIVGVCCAAFIQRAGHDVTLIERSDIGAGASYGNAGIISSGGCVPMALPGVIAKVPGMLLSRDGPLSIRWAYALRLLPWLIRFVQSARSDRVESISIALHKLLSGAHAAYEEVIGASAFDRQIASQGLLFVFSSKAAFDGSARAREIRAARGVKFDIIGRHALHALESELAPNLQHGILFDEARHALDPGDLTEELATRFSSDGGQIEKSEITAVTETEDSVVLSSIRGCRPYDMAVVAAGAWSRRLLKSVRLTIPLDTERGYHVMLPDPNIVISRPVIVPEIGFAITPMRNGVRLSGLIEFAGLDASPDYCKAERMLHQAKRVLPNLNTTGGEYWMGHRPSFPDSMPVIGPSRPQSRLFFAFGHGHQGVGFAAITGKIIASLVNGDEPPIDIAPFSPQRFARANERRRWT